MKIAMAVAASLGCLFAAGWAAAADPFAAGDDALAVKESDGSASVRARLKLTKVGPDVALVRIKAIDDSKWPDCTFTGLVLRPATATDKHFKLLGRGKVYRFKAELKKKGRAPNFADEMTRNNLGTCYYPDGTNVEVKISGVDLKAKEFHASEVYLKTK
jgi:hypothetical protein